MKICVQFESITALIVLSENIIARHGGSDHAQKVMKEHQISELEEAIIELNRRKSATAQDEQVKRIQCSAAFL